MKQTLLEIEENLKSRKESDRIMWFSMWAVLSVASFGIAWFPMMYYMIKRRNTHFQRQQKLEALILSKLKKTTSQETPQQNISQTKPRNAAAWTISTLLIVPAFYVFYVLKRDLSKHEEHEHDFLVEVIKYSEEKGVPLNLHGFTATPSFSLKMYLGLNIVSCGLAAAYWLYRIFNDYNSHFKMQWKNEDALLRFLKEIE